MGKLGVIDVSEVLRSGWCISLVDRDFDEDTEACPGALIEIADQHSPGRGMPDAPSFAVTDKISATTTYHHSLAEALKTAASAMTHGDE